MRLERKGEAGFLTKANTGLVAGLLACVTLTGCTTIGPGSLERDYPRYSQTMREIQDAHLLLNLVRLRYLETPVFLQLTSITTTYEINANADVSATDNAGCRNQQAAPGSEEGTGRRRHSLTRCPIRRSSSVGWWRN